MPLAQEFCVGRGIEIGAAAYSNFGVNAWNVDLSCYPTAGYYAEQMKYANAVATVDIVGLGEQLPVHTSSQDFVIASHVLEHSPNPIGTLLEWDRIIRPEGVLFLIVPHRERSPDRVRPRTRLVDVVEDYHAERTAGTHKETDGFLTPPTPHTHYHVWITLDVVEIIWWIIDQQLACWRLEEIEDPDSNRHDGFTLVLRKRGDPLTCQSESWVSRRALRSMLRSLDLSRFLFEKGVIRGFDLVEVTPALLLGQDALIRDRECTIQNYERTIQEYERVIQDREASVQHLQGQLEHVQQTLISEIESLSGWAASLEATLLAIQQKWVHVPRLSRLRARLIPRFGSIPHVEKSSVQS
jgi:SAM-dependent methyltransferase